jgi:hypothetical protein
MEMADAVYRWSHRHLSPPPFSSRGHPACRLAVFPLSTELSGWLEHPYGHPTRAAGQRAPPTSAKSLRRISPLQQFPLL